MQNLSHSSESTGPWVVDGVFSVQSFFILQIIIQKSKHPFQVGGRKLAQVFDIVLSPEAAGKTIKEKLKRSFCDSKPASDTRHMLYFWTYTSSLASRKNSYLHKVEATSATWGYFEADIR